MLQYKTHYDMHISYVLTTSLRQLRLFSITTFDEKEVPPSTKHREAKKPTRASPTLIVLAFNIHIFNADRAVKVATIPWQRLFWRSNENHEILTSS